MKRNYLIVCGIYKITSPSGRVYIGQSYDIFNRLNGYMKFKDNWKSKSILYYSFKKYGVKNHKFELLCECRRCDLNYMERAFIKFFDTFDTPNGLNLTTGGGQFKIAQEVKDKLSKIGKDLIIKNKKKNPNWKHWNCGRTAWNKDIPCSKETKKKISKKTKNRKLTDEHKRNIGIAERKIIAKKKKKGWVHWNVGRPVWNKGRKGCYSKKSIQRFKKAARNKPPVKKSTKIKLSKSISENIKIRKYFFNLFKKLKI